MQVDLRIVAMLAQIEAPMAAVDDENLSRIMAVLRVYTARRLPRTADIIAMRFGNMDMLVGVFGYAGANNRKIFLRLLPGRPAIDEGVVTGNKVAITHQPPGQRIRRQAFDSGIMFGHMSPAFPSDSGKIYLPHK